MTAGHLPMVREESASSLSTARGGVRALLSWKVRDAEEEGADEDFVQFKPSSIALSTAESPQPATKETDNNDGVEKDTATTTTTKTTHLAKLTKTKKKKHGIADLTPRSGRKLSVRGMFKRWTSERVVTAGMTGADEVDSGEGGEGQDAVADGGCVDINKAKDIISSTNIGTGDIAACSPARTLSGNSTNSSTESSSSGTDKEEEHPVEQPKKEEGDEDETSMAPRGKHLAPSSPGKKDKDSGATTGNSAHKSPKKSATPRRTSRRRSAGHNVLKDATSTRRQASPMRSSRSKESTRQSRSTRHKSPHRAMKKNMNMNSKSLRDITRGIVERVSSIGSKEGKDRGDRSSRARSRSSSRPAPKRRKSRSRVSARDVTAADLSNLKEERSPTKSKHRPLRRKSRKDSQSCRNLPSEQREESSPSTPETGAAPKTPRSRPPSPLRSSGTSLSYRNIVAERDTCSPNTKSSESSRPKTLTRTVSILKKSSHSSSYQDITNMSESDLFSYKPSPKTPGGRPKLELNTDANKALSCRDIMTQHPAAAPRTHGRPANVLRSSGKSLSCRELLFERGVSPNTSSELAPKTPKRSSSPPREVKVQSERVPRKERRISDLTVDIQIPTLIVDREDRWGNSSHEIQGQRDRSPSPSARMRRKPPANVTRTPVHNAQSRALFAEALGPGEDEHKNINQLLQQQQSKLIFQSPGKSPQTPGGKLKQTQQAACSSSPAAAIEEEGEEEDDDDDDEPERDGVRKSLSSKMKFAGVTPEQLELLKTAGLNIVVDTG